MNDFTVARPYTLALLSVTLIDKHHAEREGRDLIGWFIWKLQSEASLRVVGQTDIPVTETHRTPLNRAELAKRLVVVDWPLHSSNLDLFRKGHRPTDDKSSIPIASKNGKLILGLVFADGVEGYLEAHFLEDTCILDLRLEIDGVIEGEALRKRMEPIRKLLAEPKHSATYYWEWTYRVAEPEPTYDWLEAWFSPEIVVDLAGPADVRLVAEGSGSVLKFAAIGSEESITLDRLYTSRRQIQERFHKLLQVAASAETHQTLATLYDDLTDELKQVQHHEQVGASHEDRDRHLATMTGLLARTDQAQLARVNEAYHHDLLMAELDRLARTHPGLSEWIRAWAPPRAANGGIVDLIESRLRSIELIDARHQDRLERKIQDLSVFFGVLGVLGLLLSTFSFAFTLLDLSVKADDRHAVAQWLHNHGPALGWGLIFIVLMGLMVALHFTLPKWWKQIFKPGEAASARSAQDMKAVDTLQENKALQGLESAKSSVVADEIHQRNTS